MTEQLPWYEPLIRALVAAQGRNAELFGVLAQEFGAMARTCERIAEANAALAASVPEGDQAAADLGTAAERHDIRNAQTAAEGARALASLVDDAQHADHAALVALRGELVLVRAMVGDLAAAVAQIRGEGTSTTTTRPEGP